MKKIFFSALMAATLVACKNEPANTYTINGTVSGWDGQEVVLRTESDTLGTVVVANGAFQISGQVDKSAMAVVTIGNQQSVRAEVIVEPGIIELNMNDGMAKGTPLNDQLVAFSERMSQLIAEVQLPGANEDSLTQVYNNMFIELGAKNVGNPPGLMAVQEMVYELSKAEIDSVMALCDLYANDPKIQKIAKAKTAEEMSAVGKQFIEVAGVDAKTQVPAKLSEVVAQGKPVIVDFWASWCGPCRREINNYLAQYAAKYKGKVNFVGLAVWEESIEDTQKAMGELPISWPVIFCGGRGEDSPATAYGVTGIPHIMLIAPDGTIAARGIRGEAIAQAIDDLLAK